MAVTFSQTAEHYMMQAEVWLPRPVEEMWRFETDGRNFQSVTPDWLDYQLKEPGQIEQ